MKITATDFFAPRYPACPTQTSDQTSFADVLKRMKSTSNKETKTHPKEHDWVSFVTPGVCTDPAIREFLGISEPKLVSELKSSIPPGTAWRIPNKYDEPISLSDALSKLTDEQKMEINNKYDIRKIEVNSTEHNQLMWDLYAFGAVPYGPSLPIPPNAVAIHYKEDGTLGAVLAKVDDAEPKTLLEWLQYHIEKYEESLEKLKETGMFFEEDELKKMQHTAFQDMIELLQNIFAGQLEEQST